MSFSIYRGQRSRSGILMRSRMSPKRDTSYHPHLSLRLRLGSVVFSLSITITSSLASRPPIPLLLIASVLIACHVYRHSPHSCLTFRFNAALSIVSRAKHQEVRSGLAWVRRVCLYLSGASYVLLSLYLPYLGFGI